MIEHPVPQNITAYQFRLIGNMTIKQFALLGGGIGIGFLVYSTNLPGIFKWPLISIVVVIGIALAFVPYEERTLDQWFLNFFKAMYRPTKFFWRRLPKPPEFFSFTPSAGVMEASRRPDLTPYRQTQVKEFLSTLATGEAAEPADELDMFRQSGNISSLFSQVAATAGVSPGSAERVSKPSLQTRPRPLRQQTETLAQQSMAAPAVVAPVLAAAAAPSPINIPTVFTMEAAEPVRKNRPDATVPPPRGAAAVAPIAKISVQPTSSSSAAATAAAPVKSAAAIETTSYLAASGEEKAAHGESIVPAVFSKDLPFPGPPDKPNLLIGMVHDRQGAIIPGAIVEIIDSSGNTVRAMKSNNLGQFYMSSPLKDGEFTIHSEKEGLQFPIYRFSASGSVLDPVDITASG